jgi:YesN/AraC family two-component response regulator
VDVSADVEEHVMDSVTFRPYIPGVLVVEDEPSVRSFLRSALERKARVVEAHDGERAIEILRDQADRSLDLVLADYRLPKRSGLEILRMTKDAWPRIPVVIMTAFGSEQLAVQAFRSGASDYLAKPIALDALMRVVDALTTARRRSDASSARDRDPSALDPRIRRAVAFLHEHFAQPVTLTRVAREAGLSRFHFCRMFHRDIGVVFHDYLHEVRVSRARELLADHHLAVTEVAYAVGFNDLSHFDKTFRKIVGRSPTQYRMSVEAADGGKRPPLIVDRLHESLLLLLTLPML